MAIKKYLQIKAAPDVSNVLADVSEYSLRAKAMLTALGDFWTDYYRNLDPISTAMSGSVASISKEYTHLLDMVLASNITDVPIQDSDQFDLLVINADDIVPEYGDDGATVDHYWLPIADIVDTAYLCSSLFEAPVVLRKGEHFDIVRGKGVKLYVDLFGDRNITNYTYEIGEGTKRHMLMWAMDIAYNSTIIYERYGRFLYRKAHDGEQYKWMVTALMRFYENAKSTKGIQDVLNIMYGVPYTRYKDEVITAVYYVDANLEPINHTTEEPYICIETDRAKYYTYAFSELVYKVGDTVPQFSILANFNIVEDYIDTPKWWEKSDLPDALFANADFLPIERKYELMDKVLKYNTVHIAIGVSFDTYQTYLAQIKELFNVIEGGFPVYLYPVVESIFRAVFIDKVDMEDILDKIRAEMKLLSVYDWGAFIKYDGTINYYAEPEFDHADKGKQLLYNGDYFFDKKNTHHGLSHENNAYNGEKSYFTTFKYHHDNSNEILTITKLGLRQSDEYPWSTAPGLKRFAYTYNGEIIHDNKHKYGDFAEYEDNDHIEIDVTMEAFSDNIKLMDDVELDFHARLEDEQDDMCGLHYDGQRMFDGSITFRQAPDEDFTIIVNRLEAA